MKREYSITSERNEFRLWQIIENMHKKNKIKNEVT